MRACPRAGGRGVQALLTLKLHGGSSSTHGLWLRLLSVILLNSLIEFKAARSLSSEAEIWQLVTVVVQAAVINAQVQ